jgi:hypothetical protein
LKKAIERTKERGKGNMKRAVRGRMLQVARSVAELRVALCVKAMPTEVWHARESSATTEMAKREIGWDAQAQESNYGASRESSGAHKNSQHMADGGGGDDRRRRLAATVAAAEGG